jgi:hypothetical protein
LNPSWNDRLTVLAEFAVGLAVGAALWCAGASPAGAQAPDAVTPSPQLTPAATAAVSPTASLALPNPLAERWVAEQVAAGEVADLSKRFPAEKDRLLSGAFLEDLLTRPITGTVAARHGVRVSAAVISDTIDLHNADVRVEVWLTGCRFGGVVDMSQSHWASTLDLSNTRFMSAVSLADAGIDRSFGLMQSVFEGQADFSYLAVGRDVFASGAQFLDTRLGAGLSYMHVGGTAYLRQALFAGPTYFTGAQIDADLAADQVRFTHSQPGVTFTALKVGGTLGLVGAEMSGPVDFFGAQVGGNFVASQSRFTDVAVGASFSSLKVGGYAFFRQATFAGRTDFGRMEVGLDFEVAEVQFTNPDQEAAFNTMKVGGYASISKATFAGSADFVYASVALDLYADAVQFTNPNHGPNFSETKIAGHVYFTNASFAGSAIFNRTNVGADFVAYTTHFTNPKESISFSSMKVGGFASFSGSDFAGSAEFGMSPALGVQAEALKFSNPQGKASFSDLETPGYVFMVNAVFTATAEFIGAHIGGDFLANGTRFMNVDKGASFVSMRVDGSAFIHDAVFAGPLDFHHSSVGLNLEMDGTQCNGHQPANFGNFKVGGIASFTKMLFDGPVIFIGADVRGQFILDGTQFKYSDQASVAFNGMAVGDSVLMHGVTAAASVSMADATLLDLTVAGVTEGPPLVLPQLDLTRSVIKRELFLENLRLSNGLVGPSLQVLGPCVLSEVTVETQAALQRASLQTLLLTHVIWPTDTQQVRLDGISYQNISAGFDPNSWRTLLDWVDHAAYSANVYTTLEQYYRQRGYPEQADAIFVAGRRRERAESLGGLSSAGWWWNLILDLFVVYGRRPGRAFLWAGLIVAVGALLFRRKHMEPLKPEFAEQRYSAFWYSLDLLVPVLDLLAANRWTVRREYWLLHQYLRIHAILGWLLIPIGLAALSGILK